MGGVQGQPQLAGPGRKCGRRSRAWRRAASGPSRRCAAPAPLRSGRTRSPSPCRRRRLPTTMSQFLVSSLRRASCSRFSVSAAKPISSRSPFFRPSSARMSGVGSSSSEIRAAVFLTFCVGTLARWKSATAAALITMPAASRCSNTASRISAAVRTGTTSTPRGRSRCTGPETRMTRAPRGRGGFGQRVAHLAAGAVGDVAHRVERLLRGPGGDQHGLAFQVAAPAGSSAPRRAAMSSRLGQPARATMPQARYPSSGSTMRWPRCAQHLQVRLRGRVLPHVGVHGRRQHHRAGEGQIESGEEIVGQAVRELGQQVGGGGRDHQQLVLLGHADVLDGARQSGVRAGRRTSR